MTRVIDSNSESEKNQWMFGFLSPSNVPRVWRQSYARVCQYQRQLFGITAIPFMSYEAAFLYQLATDLALNHRLPADSPTCCRLRKLRDHEGTVADRILGEFAASFGMYLVGVKLRDDLSDSNRWFNHLLWRFCRRRIRRAGEQFELLSPGLVNRLESCIERHTVLEHEHPTPSLNRLVVPTGDGFSEVFRAAARLCNGVEQTLSCDPTQDTMATIGQHIGQAIIAWDCAVDFDLDHLQKHFTPLTSISDVQSAFELCQRELAAAAELCPDGSPSQEVLNNVRTRVSSRQHRPLLPSRAVLLERWGLLRQRGYAYARCEPFCCVCEAADLAVCCLSSPSADCCNRNNTPRPQQREGSAQPGEGPEKPHSENLKPHHRFAD